MSGASGRGIHVTDVRPEGPNPWMPPGYDSREWRWWWCTAEIDGEWKPRIILGLPADMGATDALMVLHGVMLHEDEAPTGLLLDAALRAAP